MIAGHFQTILPHLQPDVRAGDGRVRELLGYAAHDVCECVGDGLTVAIQTRTAHLSGLPSTFVAVADNDPLRFEGLRYVHILNEAGVAVRSHIYRAVAHGFLNAKA